MQEGGTKNQLQNNFNPRNNKTKGRMKVEPKNRGEQHDPQQARRRNNRHIETFTRKLFI
jgi:hypothetical protein